MWPLLVPPPGCVIVTPVLPPASKQFPHVTVVPLNSIPRSAAQLICDVAATVIDAVPALPAITSCEAADEVPDQLIALVTVPAVNGNVTCAGAEILRVPYVLFPVMDAIEALVLLFTVTVP